MCTFTTKQPIWSWSRLLSFLLLMGFFLFGSAIIQAQIPKPESGQYFLQQYQVKDYQAHSQNWAIVQDAQGVMYIGNGLGLLEYDGSFWRLIPLPKQSVVRSLGVDSTGTIYMGGHGQLGYLAPDSTGQLAYQSLLEEIPPEEQTFTNVWSVHATPHGVFFRTDTHLFLWAKGQMKWWKPFDWFHRSFWVRDTLYIREHGVGMKYFQGDSLALISNGERFAREGIGIILPFKDHTLLMSKGRDGFFVFDGKELIPFPTEGDAYFKENTLYKAISLPGERIACATLGGGVLILDWEGKLLGKIDEYTGLQDPTVWALGTDRQGALWMGLNIGIARAEVSSPFTYFSPDLGLEGSVESIVRHQGNLFAATGLGVFKLSSPLRTSDLPAFQSVKGISSQAWNLLSTPEGLLAATTEGLFLIRKQSVQKVSDLLFYSLYRSQKDPTLIYAGLVDGLATIRLEGGKWTFDKRIEEITQEVRTIMEDPSGALWLGTQYAGAMRVRNVLQPDPTIEHFDESHGLPAGEVTVGKIQQEVYFGTTKGFKRFDSNSQLFASIPEWGTYFSDTLYEVPRFLEDPTGKVWAVRVKDYQKEVIVLERDEGEKYIQLDTPLKRILGYDSFNAIYIDKVYPDHTWLGSDQKLIAYPTSNQIQPPPSFATLIRQVAVNAELTRTNLLALKPDQNTLRFEYSLPNYDNPAANHFQYKLEGYDEEWSSWTEQRMKEYTNLPAGTYSFKVRGKNIYEELSEEDVVEFAIEAPWYLSGWAIGLGIVVLCILGYLLLSGYVRLQSRKQALALQEERKLNEQLQRVNKLKDQFLANTSHELRTPLQGIIGLSESLLERENQADKKEDISMIISSGKRLNNLVNDILDFSKLKNYDIELRRKPINLHVLVNIILRNNAPLVRGKQLVLVNDIPVSLPAANADENRLQQVFYNLIGNSIKFTEEGHIRISAESVGKELRVSVEDSGTGVPKNKQKAIFQEFEQGDGSISREFTGTGLGLSISKRLVELHGGEMWVESDPESGKKGSTFFFTLPISQEPATGLTLPKDSNGSPQTFTALATHSKGNGRPSSQNQTIRILVIDDEAINQQVLKHHLSAEKFHVTQAMNGEEGLTIIAKEPKFDLVLLDVMMPRMSGYEVCQKIREKYLASELPVIMVTAKDQIQDIVQGLALGANDYLPKPFFREELLARINTQLDLHRIFHVAGRFVPHDFLRALDRERITEVVLGDHTERVVTVQFTDIRGYTSLSESMTPEENFRFVNAFHKRMGPLIQQNQGFVNQYLGDAIMAIFPESPELALRSAIGMQQKINAYNVQREKEGWRPIKIGIGLHTGSLIMGIIGDENRMDAATIADSVNTASRIESLTKHYGVSILLSDDSLRHMTHPDEFHFRYLGKVKVKGKKEPVGLYECYDGDSPGEREAKQTSLTEFESGLEQFFNREFAQAAATFDKVLKASPADQPAKYFRNRSSHHLLNGVPEDWTGVEVMTFK